MKIDVTRVDVAVVLTLTRTEVRLLEAGMDVLTDLSQERVEEHMARKELTFDNDIAYALWDKLDDLMGELK